MLVDGLPSPSDGRARSSVGIGCPGQRELADYRVLVKILLDRISHDMNALVHSLLVGARLWKLAESVVCRDL